MNKYSNRFKMFELSDKVWDHAYSSGVAGLKVSYTSCPPYMSVQEKEFVNMASCSYLGLDTHPQILQGAIDGINDAGSMHLTTPRYKMALDLLLKVEDNLKQHFNNSTAVIYTSCSMATSTFLPLYASGVLTSGNKPVIIFDKNAHFSINHVKPICADETEVITCKHNDLNFIEDMCKKNPSVAYIAEGVYSINGISPIKDIEILQDKYGLFVFFDDSHGISVVGGHGEGMVLSEVGKLNPLTVVVGSLAKAFGACGGALLLGNPAFKDLLIKYGSSWSQYSNSAGLGAIRASINIHNTQELKIRQEKWKSNLLLVDQLMPSLVNNGMIIPTRIFNTSSPKHAILLSKFLLEQGFYVSPVFFPTVAKDSPGIRFMPRADMDASLIKNFCDKILMADNLY